jgi:YidC/Oxa1 family membrane protein insertase
MGLWTSFVDLIYSALFALASMFGGNMAIAIAVLSAIVRLALLPLTLRIAYRALEHQAKLKRLEPRLAELRRRYKNDAKRLLEETAKVYREHQIAPFDIRGALGSLAQAPIFIGVFAAVRRGIANARRFFWIKDLAKPDGILLAICAAVMGISAILAPNVTAQQRPVIFIATVAITILIFGRIAAGMAIYSIASAAVGLVQAVMVRRHARRLR